MSGAAGPAPEFAGDFDKDVPAAIQDEVLTRIVEAAWGYTEDKDISIIDVESSDVLNMEVTGTIMIDGVEHSFHIRDGNNNGTEIVAWNAELEIERQAPDPFILIPSTSRVNDAIYEGSAERFLAIWAVDIAGAGEHGEELSKLPSSYAYDAHFAPGTGAAETHRKKAATFGYEIGRESDAVPVRKRLIEGIFKVIPLFDENDTAAERLKLWAELKDPETERGSEVAAAFTAMFDRMARDNIVFPDEGEISKMKELGVFPGERLLEVSLRKALWADMITLRPVEGFDPKDLPENPMASLVHRLDPSLVSSTRVDPLHESAQIFEGLCSYMSRALHDEVTDHWFKRAEAIGYELAIEEVPEEPDDTPEMGM